MMPALRIGTALALIALLLTSVLVLGALPDLQGKWAMLQIYPQIAVLPLAGEVSQASHVVQFVEIEQDGETLRMIDEYCFTCIDSGTPLVTTEIPAAFMASLSPLPRTATVTEQAGEFLFVQQPYVEVRGAVLENIENEDLPVSSDDPRVFDQDGDGNPGMTVSINIFGVIKGQMYIVQRVRYSLSGRAITQDLIEGTVAWSDEQNILGVSNPFLQAEASSFPDPDPTKHVFVMIRADEDWTCMWLQEHWEEAFGVHHEGQE